MKWYRYFVRQRVEVGTATPRNPRPGYRWVDGWAEVTERGLSCPMRRSDVWRMAREKGFTATFCEDEAQARAMMAARRA